MTDRTLALLIIKFQFNALAPEEKDLFNLWTDKDPKNKAFLDQFLKREHIARLTEFINEEAPKKSKTKKQ